MFFEIGFNVCMKNGLISDSAEKNYERLPPVCSSAFPWPWLDQLLFCFIQEIIGELDPPFDVQPIILFRSPLGD